MTRADGLFGVLGAVLVGSLLAVGVAIGLSPLAPIGAGRARSIRRRRSRLTGRCSVLGFSYSSPDSAWLRSHSPICDRPSGPFARQDLQLTTVGSRLVGTTLFSGLPPPAKIGVGFTLDPGHGSNLGAGPFGSARDGARGAHRRGNAYLREQPQLFCSHPALYGWNWSYALESVSGGNVPPQLGRLLNHDPAVAAWSEFGFANAQIDGQTVPILLGTPHAERGASDSLGTLDRCQQPNRAWSCDARTVA